MKITITCITPVLQAILDFFPDIISFQHVFHLGVGRSQIEWKLKVKTQISVFPWAKIGQNDHSNPYIESTTVLSDTAILDYFAIIPSLSIIISISVRSGLRFTSRSVGTSSKLAKRFSKFSSISSLVICIVTVWRLGPVGRNVSVRVIEV